MNPVRLGVVLVIAGVVLIVGSLGIFSFFFYGQDISTNINDWGAFGSYLSGVLGVSISTLALIGAVVAIYQQHKTDQRVKDHAIATDLMRSVERIEDSIDTSLSKLTINVLFPDRNARIETDALSILTGLYTPEITTRVIPRFSTDAAVFIENVLDKKLSEQERLEKLRLFDAFTSTCGKLRLIRDLLSKQKAFSGHNVAALYYKRKYKLAVERLRQAGYPLEPWDDLNEL